MGIRERIDAMGGRMKLTSSIGRGTEVSIRLPTPSVVSGAPRA